MGSQCGRARSCNQAGETPAQEGRPPFYGVRGETLPVENGDRFEICPHFLRSEKKDRRGRISSAAVLSYGEVWIDGERKNVGLS